jgi:hypothetical protein
MRKLHVLIGIAALLAVAPVQAEEPVAPRVPAIFDRLFDEAILVEGYGFWERSSPAPLRTAQPLSEPVTWFGANSVLAAARQADPRALLYTNLLLDITPEGTIAACRYSPTARKPVDEAALCGEIAGQRFLPQLADDGTPVRGQFRLGLSTRSFPAEPGDPPRPLFTAERDITPAPMIAPSAERLTRFPPFDFEVSSLYREPRWKTAPQPGWGATPQEGPMTGLILFRSPQGLRCRALAPDSDPARNAAACTYARETLAPDWSGVEGNRDWIVPLAILHRAEGMRAIGPDPDFVRETVLAEGAEDALVAALTRPGVLGKDRTTSPLVLALDANPDGSLRHCRVAKTTGTDSADIAACTAARETVRLVPVEDVFGTPNPLASMFWRAKPEAQ